MSNRASCVQFSIISIGLALVLIIVLVQAPVKEAVSVVRVVQAAGPLLSAGKHSDKHGVNCHVRETRALGWGRENSTQDQMAPFISASSFFCAGVRTREEALAAVLAMEWGELKQRLGGC